MTKVGGEHRSVDARFTNIRKQNIPRGLIRVRCRKAVFNDGAHVGKLTLLFSSKALGGKLRVSDDNLLHTHFHRRSNELENFITSQVAGRQNHIVLGNPF